LSRPACRSAGAGAGARWPWRRQSGSNTDRTSATCAGSRGVHRTTLARSQRRTRSPWTRRRARPLKNWLTWDWTPWRGTICNRHSRLDWRRLVHRARAGLRHDHSRSRCLRTRWRSRWLGLTYNWRLRRRLRRTRRRRAWRCDIHLRRRGWRSNRTRRHWTRLGWRCNCGWSLRRHNRYDRRRERRTLRSNTCRSDHARRRNWRRYRGNWRLSNRRRRSSRLSFMNRRRCRTRRSSRRGRRSRLLVSDNGFENIPGLGDMRQVDLGLDLFRT